MTMRQTIGWVIWAVVTVLLCYGAYQYGWGSNRNETIKAYLDAYESALTFGFMIEVDGDSSKYMRVVRIDLDEQRACVAFMDCMVPETWIERWAKKGEEFEDTGLILYDISEKAVVLGMPVRGGVDGGSDGIAGE